MLPEAENVLSGQERPFTRREAHRLMETAKAWVSKTLSVSNLEGNLGESLQGDVWLLLSKLIEVGTRLAETAPLPEHVIREDWLLEEAEALVAALRERRERQRIQKKIEKLEAVAGRTHHEAEAHRQKATELRERHDL